MDYDINSSCLDSLLRKIINYKEQKKKKIFSIPRKYDNSIKKMSFTFF